MNNDRHGTFPVPQSPSLVPYSLSPNPHRPLLTAHWPLLTAHWPLLTAHWPLLTAHWPLATAFCLLLLVGCGKSGPELVPVHGKVTYGGGEWPAGGLLYFAPDKVAPGLPARPARAEFSTDGSYAVTSFQKGDGLIPGHYQISVECWKDPPQMGATKPPVSYAPEKYQSGSTSGLEVTIEPGSRSKELNFDIPKP